MIRIISQEATWVMQPPCLWLMGWSLTPCSTTVHGLHERVFNKPPPKNHLEEDVGSQLLPSTMWTMALLPMPVHMGLAAGFQTPFFCCTQLVAENCPWELTHRCLRPKLATACTPNFDGELLRTTLRTTGCLPERQSWQEPWVENHRKMMS